MGEIVNLRRVKKVRVRAAEAARAEANRTLHGTSTVLRRAARVEQARAAQNLDGARIQRPPEPEED